jgi:hypothetical protein
MADVFATQWSKSDFCITVSVNSTKPQVQDLALSVYDRVCRSNFLAPGFCLINLGTELSSQAFRQFMITLANDMRHIHDERSNDNLALMSCGRFDQQVSTKPHRDGGPEECFLMLGYEPSQIRAELLMSDYSKCAFDMGLTPSDFLEKHNPMFAAGERLLQDYTTRVTCFSNQCYQILLINNSIAPYLADAVRWQGVLHTAAISNPDDSLRRVVNSMLFASVPSGTPEPVSKKDQDEFVQTQLVRRRGYDKLNLGDDT